MKLFHLKSLPSLKARAGDLDHCIVRAESEITARLAAAEHGNNNGWLNPLGAVCREIKGTGDRVVLFAHFLQAMD